MADFSPRRVVAVAAVAGALVGGTVAAGVAMASTSGSNNTASPSSEDSSLATAPVIRTTLTTSVQEGGSIGFEGSYTIASPSGASAQEIEQDQQAVAQDQQAVSADQTAESDASASDAEEVSAAQTNVATMSVTVTSDEAKQAQDCAGTGVSTPTCTQDAQKVGQDQAQLSQAQQQLAAAQGTATRDQNQNQAKVASDQTKLQGDQSTLALAQASAENPGTTYTALPQVGDVISQDQSIYSVSNEPVPLLYGSIAAYRAFYDGMSDGADVGELTQDLITLGYGTGLTQSDHFSASTVTAVERWQSAVGLPATGEILLGQVVFEPGPIRITSVTPSVGASVGVGGGGGGGGSGGGSGSGGGGGGGGTVLSATSTTPIVTVDLDVSQEYLVKPGDAVSIVLPDGTSTVGGHIETVGNVATCPSGSGTGTGTGATNGSSTAAGSLCSSGGSGSSSNPTVPVSITLDSTPKLATLDEAPVNVNITTQRVPNALAVPVSALLALQGGGYGVQVVRGDTNHLVGVTTGLYGDNLVQVSGSGIRVGTQVEVPSS
jgi:putative peptidoglycan binding protein